MKLSIDKIFLFIALTWGLVTIFLVPPFEVMDEQRHYVRAGAIAEGVWNCTNGKLQISEKKIDLINYSEVGRIAFKPREKFDLTTITNYKEPTGSGVVSVNSGLCSTPPLGHAIAAVGLKLGDLAGNQLIGFYLGRMANLLVSVYLVYLAVKTTPVAKKMIFFVGLIPTVTFFYASIGYDSIILSSSLLLVAYSLKLHLQKEKIRLRDLLLLGILALPQIVIKPVYFPVVVGIFLLAFAKLGAKQRQATLIVFAAVLVVVLVYIAQIFSLSTNLNKIDSGLTQDHFFLETESQIRQTRGFTYDPGFQLKRLLGQPQHFILAFLYSVILFGPGLMFGMIGITGWGGFRLFLWIYVLVILLGTLVVGRELGKIKIGKKLSWAIVAGVGTSVILIFLSMYLLDTPKDTELPIVSGVQGRYFLPLLMPLFLALSARVKNGLGRLKNDKVDLLSVFIQVLIILGTIVAYIKRYYV